MGWMTWKHGPLLAVAGCLVGRYHAEDLAPELPEVDLWLDNSDLEAWPAMLARKLGLPEPTVPGRILSTGPSYAWLKISDGCRHACSFCAIPNIRGGHRSHCKDMIVREARALLDQGVKELNLVAQDLTEWGCDLDGKQDLRTLLDGLLPLPGLERLRLMYLYPAGMTHEMLKYLREAGKPFVPYFDVPVQHSHPDVLSRMGRPFARNPREAIDRIRNVFPEAALRTSIMVGFPGETEEHFEHLREFIEEVRFQHLGVFAYRAEEGTPAAAMPGQIPNAVKERRAAEAAAVAAELETQYHTALLGTTQQVLFEQEENGLYAGHAMNYVKVYVQAAQLHNELRAVRASLRETGAQELKIFAKIENMTGLHRLDEILPLADVVVIARGDLGNAMPLWELPRAQTLIASKCRAAKRPFMVSTQMLHSMHHAAVPTRAEVTDVYQAARSGADYLLLTGETAVGEYPVEAMTYFAKIAANGWADAE